GDGIDDDEPLCRDARLAVVLISGPDGGRRSQLQVGVGKKDVGVGAAELEHRLLKSTSGQLGDARSGVRASGEGDSADAVVRDDRLDRRAGNEDGPQQALREARLSKGLL